VRDKVLVLEESAFSLVVVEPRPLRILERYPLPFSRDRKESGVKPVLGLESMALIPDAVAPHKATLVFVEQLSAFHPGRGAGSIPRKSTRSFVCDIELRETTEATTAVLALRSTGNVYLQEVADMVRGPGGKGFLFLSDEKNVVYWMNDPGKPNYRFPSAGRDREGICLDDEDRAWIVSENGNGYMYELRFR
jgi:hypothetical protein